MFLLKNKEKQYFYGYSTLTESVLVKPLKLPGLEPQFLRCAAPSLVSVLDTKRSVDASV